LYITLVKKVNFGRKKLLTLKLSRAFRSIGARHWCWAVAWIEFSQLHGLPDPALAMLRDSELRRARSVRPPRF
jgi:hypothetical protein